MLKNIKYFNLIFQNIIKFKIKKIIFKLKKKKNKNVLTQKNNKKT